VPCSRRLSAAGNWLLGNPCHTVNWAFPRGRLIAANIGCGPIGFSAVDGAALLSSFRASSTFGVRTSQIRPDRAPPAPRDGGVHPTGRR
jgi:threonine dehydrogenase-like Zn-dependent dehydrogenase